MTKNLRRQKVRMVLSLVELQKLGAPKLKPATSEQMV